MNRIIKITEECYNAFINGEDVLFEGVDWSKRCNIKDCYRCIGREITGKHGKQYDVFS